MREVSTNLLICNLAISDIFICLVTIPFTPASVFLSPWPFGSFLCRIIPAGQAIGVYVSAFSCSAISVDRYKAVRRYFTDKQAAKRRNIIIIALIWGFSMSCSVPLSAFRKIVFFEGHGEMCFEDWGSKEVEIAFLMLDLIFHMIIPFLVITAYLLLVCLEKIGDAG